MIADFAGKRKKKKKPKPKEKIGFSLIVFRKIMGV